MPRAKKSAEPAEANDSASDRNVGSNVAPDDTADCFLALKEIDLETARLGQKKARTIARFENMGVDVEAVREVQRLEHKDDAPDWIKRVVAAATRLRVIPSATDSDGQITFMPGLKVEALSKDAQDRLDIARATGDGYNSGRHGGTADDNPHKAGSPLYVAWGNGCIDGAADRAIAKEQRDEKKARKKAAAEEAEAAEGTALERDEAAYRAGTQERVTMPADPV